MQDPTEGAQRKLAAIMFTDIKGFSKKMAENEARAFELLKMHDAIMRVLIAKFSGNVIKSLGDSFMVDFSSAVNAVKCAVEAQKRFWNFNRDKEEFERVEIRIGIHLGDVLVRDEDMIGDGVNVASRIEAITEPSRICITQEVYMQIRNKIPVQVFEIGPLQLKNIPEPVQVYELLLESIPELSQPSESARQMSGRQQTSQAEAQAAAREAEEAREAKRVEEARKRSERDLAAAEESRRKKIEQHYARAEEFVRLGRPEDAERELAEIYKLEPALQEATNQRRQEEEAKERAAQEHLARARELIKSRSFDEAEAQVNEIFRVFPLHVGAQQMLQQIEDERYRVEEEVRLRKADISPKGPTEDDLKIDELLEKARHELEIEQFTEAIFTLRELFLIDPNHSVARRLEENIRQAEQAKQELLRLQVEQEQENKRREELDRLRRRLADHRSISAPVEAEQKSAFDLKLAAQIVGGIVAVVLLIYVGSRAYRVMFPKTASVAVLQFAVADADAVEEDLQDALPMLLAEDLARCSHVTVTAPGTALQFDASPASMVKAAQQLNPEYLLTGMIERSSGGYTFNIRLYSTRNQKPVFTRKIESSLLNLPRLRTEIVQTFIDELDLAASFTPLPQLTPSAEAYALYLRAVRLMRSGSYSNAMRAVDALRQAFGYDTNFPDAYALFALAAVRIYENREADGDLDGAMEAAEHALRNSPDNACALLAKAEVHRYRREYKKAVPALEASLESQPENAEAYRELALLSIIGGRLDDALQFSRTALTIDPRGPRSYLTEGIVLHFQKDYAGAASSYTKAIDLGSSDSLITVKYLLNAWLEAGNTDRVVRYLESVVTNIAPGDYRYHYWIGRAYQFAASVASYQQWLDQGHAITQKSIDANPQDAVAYAYGGLILTRLGRFPAGETAVKRAFELNPSVEYQYRLANMYSVQKNKEKALEALRLAIERKFDFAELLNPDFFLLAREQEFSATLVQDIGPRPNVK